VFWFTLPVSFETRASTSVAEVAVPQSSRPLGGRVLLAEDNPVNREVALINLQSRGVEVVAVNDGREAVAAVANEHFDLVLMDCQMPVMDGYAAARQWREIEKARATHLPVIALTANAMDGDRERCLAAGMDDYLPKPFKRDQLARVLARHVAHEVVRNTPAQAPVPQATEEGIIDERALENIREIAPGGGLVRKVLGTYLESAPRLIEEFSQNLENGAAETMHRAVHTLKSSSANVGAMKLSALCKEIEADVRAGNIEGVRGKADRLRNEHEAALRVLRQKLDKEAA
jgi:CheY-like chemotaxis protein/HPt (histidine-containing phosphotransfer) domain-containing protein